ncbi:cupin [Nonomuraea antimicrobica]
MSTIPKDSREKGRPGTTVTPFDLFASVLHLHPDGTIHAGTRPAGSGQDGWQLTALHAKTGADVHAGHWQVHPGAERVVCCLVGKIRLHLRPQRPGQREEEIKLMAGTAAIVPRGRWHRVELDIPSAVMAVTLPPGTRLEEEPRGPTDDGPARVRPASPQPPTA